MTLPYPEVDQSAGEMLTEEVLAAGDRRLVSVVSLPGAQLAGKSAARALLCPAQLTEHSYLIHLVSPPPLIQLQYCTNNFLQLPREEQTSEARRALPSPPRSQWAAGTKAGRRFAKSLILSNSYSQGCIKKQLTQKNRPVISIIKPFQNPMAT